MPDRKFIEVDKNMLVSTKIEEANVRFLDARGAPFEIYGLYNPSGEPVFRRMPAEAAKGVNGGVSRLSLCTAGGRVRFSSDTAYIAIKSSMPYIGKYDHMPLTNVCGFDLYIDDECGSRYYRPFRPGYGVTGGYESILRFDKRKTRFFTINFPTYSPLDSLYIGVEESAHVGRGLPYRSSLPIVYYGSSITQGACASHPGNTYPSIISRRMNLDYINLGFSGRALGEESIARYMAGLDMLAFVCDYDHNAPDAPHLLATHRPLYDIIRQANPTLPYIMLSRPNYDYNAAESIARRNVVIDTYHYARGLGDENVYYIDGQGIFRGPDEDLCTVDGVHPTDVGFLKLSDAIERVMVRALRKTNFGSKDLT